MKCLICNSDNNSSEKHVEFIVPLYKSAEQIELLFERVNNIAEAITLGSSLHLVFDGLDEVAKNKVKEFSGSLRIPLKITQLSRNFGVGPALMAGMSHSDSCMSICFGSDLQEPESLFKTFVDSIAQDKIDLIMGHRVSRDDPFVSRIGAKFYWWLVKKFINPSSPVGGFDVFGINKTARSALSSLPELNTNITSQMSWIGFRQQFIDFERTSRVNGKSTWTLKRKLGLFFDSIYGFTTLPITFITLTGAITSAIFLILIALSIIGSISGLISLPGYVTLLLVSALGSSVTILSLGIVGNYISRTFDNSKGRPTFLVASIEELETKANNPRK